MNVETLTIKRQEAEARFNSVKAQKEAAETEVAKHNEELTRLQGEYRAYSDLIDELSGKDLPDPASIIEPEEDLKAKGKKRGTN